MKAKRILSLLLCAVLLCSVLCISALAADETADETPDFVEVLARGYHYYEPETPVMTVNGQTVTWGMYYYWLTNAVFNYYYYDIYYGGSLPEDFSDGEADILAQTTEQAKYFPVTRAQFAKEGLVLSAEDEELISSTWTQLEENYGDELDAALEESFLTRDSYMTFLYASQELNALSQSRVGDNGDKLTDEQVLTWAEENGYVGARHILLMFPAGEGEGGAVTDAQKEEVLAKAQELLDQLNAVEDEAEQDELFVSLRDEYTEDVDAEGKPNMPDGYFFPEGMMVEEFYNASLALEENAISEPVESAYGYHIIQRLPLTADCVTTDQDTATYENMTLRQSCAISLFNEELIGWLDSAEVEWNEETPIPSLNELFAAPKQSNKTALIVGFAALALLIVLAVFVLLPKKDKVPVAVAEAEAPAELAEEAPVEEAPETVEEASAEEAPETVEEASAEEAPAEENSEE